MIDENYMYESIELHNKIILSVVSHYIHLRHRVSYVPDEYSKK